METHSSPKCSLSPLPLFFILSSTEPITVKMVLMKQIYYHSSETEFIYINRD